MAAIRHAGLFDCLLLSQATSGEPMRTDVRDVQRLLALRDALRANEPAPFDAAYWMADAIDHVLQEGGSLDQWLGLRRRGKPSIRRAAEIARRDTLLRALATRIPETQMNRRARTVIEILSGRKTSSDHEVAALIEKLRSFTNLPCSTRQVMRILSSRQ